MLTLHGHFMDKLLLFLLLFGVTNAEFLPNGCPADFHTHHLLPHESDCNKFYYCNFGEKVLRQCSAGLYFDFSIQVCNWPNAVNCKPLTTEQTTTQQITTDGYEDTAETESYSTTSDGGNTDYFTTKPVTEIEITNEPSTTIKATTEFVQSTTTEDVIDTSEDDEVSTERESNTGSTEAVTTENVITTTTASICPDGMFGHVPHPELCDSYFLCSLAWDPIQFFCAPGLEFSPELERCVEIAKGGCTWRQTTTEPTSVETQSTVENTDTTEAVTSTTISEFTTQPTEATTTESVVTTSTASPICPEGVFGHVPHPELCDSYYLCTGWDPIQLFCSPGFEFSPELDRCVVIGEGGCTWSKTTPKPTSESTIEVTQTTDDVVTITSTELTDTTEGVKTTDTTQDVTTTEKEFTQPTEGMTTETVVTTSTVSPICPDGVFGHVPHPELCDSYYLCTGWDPIQLFCSPGFEFSPELDRCVVIGEGGCTWSQTTPRPTTTLMPEETQTTVENTDTTEAVTSTTISEFTTQPTEATTTESVVTTSTASPICPEGVFGHVPHPELCDSYYLCTGWDPIQLFCSPGFEFSPELDRCVVIGEGGCTWSKTTPKPTSESTLEVTQTTDDVVTITSTELTDTTEGVKTTDTTQDVTTTEKEFTQPTEGMTTETVVTTSTVSPICPDGVFGHVPHPELCDSYFLCTGWDPIQLFCSPGFEFSPELDRCVVIGEGGCTWRQTTPKPTTEPTPEVTQTADDIVTTTPTELIDTTEDTTQDVTTTEKESTQPTEETTTETGVTTSTVSPICPDGVFGHVPHPKLCDSYYLCTGWDPIQLFCSPGFEFSPELDRCVVIGEGGCTWSQTTPRPTTTVMPEETQTTVENTDTTEAITSTTIREFTTQPTEATTTESVVTTSTASPICPEGVFGHVPHPELCDSYYLCTGWDPIQLFCSPGFEFSPELDRCVVIAEGGCTWLQAPPTSELTTTEEMQTTVVHTDTTEGITTINKDLSTQFIRPTTENVVTTTDNVDKTTTENVATTTERVVTTTTDVITTTTGPICPPNYIGNVPHPEKCDSYYICTGWDPIQLFCSPGLEFDPQLDRCVPITEDGCTANKNSRRIR